MNKALVAYSGGLDTSCILHWIKKKYNTKVWAFCADIIGLSPSEKKALTSKARKTGAEGIFIKDLRREFLEDFAFSALKADAVYEGDYFLATALGRPLIAKHLVKTAKALGIKTIVHGCTGKGNDQVRIEMGIRSLDPSMEILAPLRFWEMKTREDEVEYARRNKIPVSLASKKYSIDENLWGIAIECGELEDPSKAPPEDAWQWSRKKPLTKTKEIEISFEKGVPVGISGKKMSSVQLVTFLNKLGASYGIGRSDLVESRVVGIKSREIYEAPAAKILHKAHFDLERMVLDRLTLHYKEKVAKDFANLIYEGRWFTPLRESLSAFVDKTQEFVSGCVRILLKPNSFEIIGRSSPHSRYSASLATYSKGDDFNREDATGFLKIYSLDAAKRK